jgi:DNA-binding MarR family transcriptional regulator
MAGGQPSESVVHLLHRAGQIADATFMRHSDGLTPRLFEILKAVGAIDGVSQIEIMSATGIDRSSVASLVAKLVDLGFLTRRKRTSDNRTYAIHVTADGTKALRRNRVIAERVDAQLLSPFGLHEKRELMNLLRSLAMQT